MRPSLCVDSLLALDKQRRLVMIELKRTDYGGHMDLQAIRYAAMVAAMTFEQVAGAYEAYLTERGMPDADEAAERIREFLELPPDEEIDISTEVRILLVAGDFSREITTAVLWLNRFDGMDIRCVRLVAYEINGRNYLDIEQVIPLPQAADYQVQIRMRKRQAVLTMIQKLSQKGVKIEAVSKMLPPSRLRVISGQPEGQAAIEDALRAAGVNEPQRYFTDAPFVEDGTTYVLTKMWGRGTEPMLVSLRDAFAEAGVSFQSED